MPAPAAASGAWVNIGWFAAAAAGLLAAAVLLGGWWRRRRALDDARAFADPDDDERIVPAAPVAPRAPVRAPPPPLPPPPTAPAPVAPGRAALDVELVPRRAGTNLLSAAVDYLLVVRNLGSQAARDIRVDIRLASASAGQEPIIAALFAAPIERSVVAPFDLPGGMAIELTGMAMTPRDTLDVMAVQGRALFVPVLAVNLLYRWEGAGDGPSEGQTGRSFVVGIDRGAGTKLQPFRLEIPRMYEAVRQLPYTVAVDR